MEDQVQGKKKKTFQRYLKGQSTSSRQRFVSAFSSLVDFKCFPGALQLFESSDHMPPSPEIALPLSAPKCIQIHILADREEASSRARA